jgi:FKBP-type peptidyl-prolyl cis-trans isomerase FkpA
MAKKRQRIFALTAALVFLISSVAFTGLVIYQMSQQDKQNSEKRQEDVADQLQEQQQNSSKGKKMDNFTPVASVPELQKIDITEGTGTEAKPGDTVVVHYTLALAKDGAIIESSKDTNQPATLSLAKGAVIDGWVEGVPGMKVGGKRRLLIPARLAYGEQGAPQGGIDPNTDLVFDIELVDVPPKQQ